MLKYIYVDNFKALNQFQMDFEPFTVIVGNNMSGKSTVLQVLDFVSGLVREDFGVILERRGWKVSDIKSQLQKSQKITIKCVMELPAEAENILVHWEIQLLAYTQKNVLELSYERVWLRNGGTKEVLLSYLAFKEFDNFIKGQVSGEQEALPKFQANASLLKIMDLRRYPVLQSLKDFWANSDSFELLSPEKMRLSSRGEVNTIGSAGEKLPAFIKSMALGQKQNFVEKVREVLDDKIISVDARTKGKPGWTHLIAEEAYQGKRLLVESKNMSDGTLRLLAFLAICEMNKEGIMMLDEIENGINLDYAEKVIRVLGESCNGKNRQMAVTTHSPIFLDYVEKKQIRYLYRASDTGICKCSVLSEQKELGEKMEYLYPGELFMNMSNYEIINKLMGKGDAS